MNRFIKGGLLALMFSLSRAPVYAANLPLFDPTFSIVPQGCDGLPLGAGGVLQFIQNIMNAMVSVGVIVLVLVIAYAGFLFILTPTNPESRSKAKSVLGNAVIGFIIVLSAWVGVDFIMKLLYDGGGQFGPWNKILTVTDDSKCINPVTLDKIKGLPGLVDVGINSVTTNGGGGNGSASISVGPAGKRLCDPNNSACSVQALMNQGLSEKQAQAMSCIAVSESSGIPSKYNAQGSGACGTFQILAGTRTSNWYKPSLHSGQCSVSTPCTNATCNLQTAVIMFKQSGGYQPWICPNCNATAHQCVANFDPGHGE